MSVVSGHCFCNSIQFEVQGPEKFACFCYCESCQRAAGAPVVPWASYQKADFRVTEGKMCFRESSPGVTRGHCADCGSLISYETDSRPDDIDIALSSLDDWSLPEPRAHIFTEDKPKWLHIGDDLPVYEKNIS